MLRAFRIIGMAEAVSFLLLLGIAMPLKYMAGMPLAVRYAGLAHGILFLLYLGAALGAAVVYKWKVSRLFLAGVASLLPFGPFAFDKWILRGEPR
jgi:integral membrane protein